MRCAIQHCASGRCEHDIVGNGSTMKAGVGQERMHVQNLWTRLSLGVCSRLRWRVTIGRSHCKTRRQQKRWRNEKYDAHKTMHCPHCSRDAMYDWTSAVVFHCVRWTLLSTAEKTANGDANNVGDDRHQNSLSVRAQNPSQRGTNSSSSESWEEFGDDVRQTERSRTRMAQSEDGGLSKNVCKIA